MTTTTTGDTTMPRYILIDSESGYVWGDTADLPGWDSDLDGPVAAAQRLDETLGEHDREYEEVSRLDGRSGYEVYRADVRGSEAVPVCMDGQDQEYIDAVLRDCEHVATIAFR